MALCQRTEAHSYAKRLEIHYTLKHGSWLNIAEIELNAMTRQCLARRLMNLETVRQEVSAWENMRNEDACKVTWHFTADDARNKLSSLYPRFTHAEGEKPSAQLPQISIGQYTSIIYFK